MLPIHIALGLALGWAFIRQLARPTVLVAIGVLASLALGVAAAVGDAEDSSAAARLAGVTAIAAVNVIIGAILGGVVAYLVGQRTRNRGTRA